MNDEPARILVVDDEEIALNNLKHVLKKEGYDFDVVFTNVLKRAAKTTDILLKF